MHAIAPGVRGIEELLEPFDDPGRGVPGANEVEPARVDIGDRRLVRARALHEAFAAESRQGTPSLQQQDGGDGRGRSVHLARAMILELRHTGGVAVEPGR